MSHQRIQKSLPDTEAGPGMWGEGRGRRWEVTGHLPLTHVSCLGGAGGWDDGNEKAEFFYCGKISKLSRGPHVQGMVIFWPCFSSALWI